MADNNERSNIGVADNEGGTSEQDIERIKHTILETASKMFEEVQKKLIVATEGLSKIVLNMKMRGLQQQKSEQERQLREKIMQLKIDKIFSENVTEEEKKFNKFICENDSKLKEFGMLRNHKDNYEFLIKNPQLICTESEGYFTMWCIQLKGIGELEFMEQVARQAVCLNHIALIFRRYNFERTVSVQLFFSEFRNEEEYNDFISRYLPIFMDLVEKPKA